jgi:hypothetical protein
MATDSLTIIHTLISLIGIVAGFVVLGGMFRSEKVCCWTEVFLFFTIATSVTGYFFPFHGLTPAHIVGAISLVVLAIAVHALWGEQLQGGWRAVYVVCAVIAQWLNVFVLVAQLFDKVPFLHRLAPHGEEPPFGIAQGVVLLLFIWFAIRGVRNFKPAQARSA